MKASIPLVATAAIATIGLLLFWRLGSTDTQPRLPAYPPQAKLELVESLRSAMAAQHDPADGGGRAWLDTALSSAAATVGSPGHWTIVYEAGPLGVAADGMVVFLPSPFWGWSPPQTVDENAPGFTTATTTAAGIELQTDTSLPPMMGIRIGGRRLQPGEQLRVSYGAGGAGAIADRFAERASRFWIGVDGDGDGLHSFLADSPAVVVAPGPAARLLVTLPTTARPGDDVRLVVAVVDARGDAGVPFSGTVRLESQPPGLRLPAEVSFDAADGGSRSVDAHAATTGTYRVRAHFADGPSAESNPLVVFANAARVRWADLHGHSAFSDGTGQPDEYFAYARDIAALDIVALTDHDHWGTLPLDAHPEMWTEIRDQVRRFNDPGRFVTLLGYEWTSWIYGHRHVLYFEDDGEVFSSLDQRYEAPEQLWQALRGKPALTFAHHSAGGPIATDWSIAPDPVLEPLTEVVSVHGVSEAADAPLRIYASVPGNFVRDALDRGYALGFVGSGDSHDGHPGLTQIAGNPTGGLAAVFTDELSREGVLDALRQRHVYATSGPRIYLRVSLAGHPMGATIAIAGNDGEDALGKDPQLHIHVVGSADLERVDIIRSGAIAASTELEGREGELNATLPDLASGEYVYVRVIQKDQGMAWSSPFFLR